MSAMTAAPLASYRDSLAQDSPEDSGTSQPWLDAHRREAMASLRRLNFPQRREEAWRYTSVDRLLKHDFIPARERELPGVDIDSLLLRKLDSHRVVFVNGRFAPALSSRPAAFRARSGVPKSRGPTTTAAFLRALATALENIALRTSFRDSSTSSAFIPINKAKG